MKKRGTALLLALCLGLALSAPALAEGGARQAADQTAAPEAAETQTLAFDDLDARLRAGYYPLLALEESVKSIEEIDYEHMELALRDQLNEIASAQWMMISFQMTQTDEYKQLEQAYNAMREQYDAIRDGKMQSDNADALRQLRSAEDQMLVFGETLYIALKGMESQDAALSRTIAQLDRTLTELELRRDLGQVSALTVEQAAVGRAQAVSGQKTLRMNYETYLLQLKSMTGTNLGAALKLGALPKVTAAELDAMDLEADLKRAMDASYDLLAAKKDYDAVLEHNWDMGEDAKTYEQKRAGHTANTARFTYEDKLRTFELNFRTLYAQVQDCAQVLDAARTACRGQEKALEAAELKYQLGDISANALADAKDELASARTAVTDAERELFSKYRSYHWAVERGILNG